MAVVGQRVMICLTGQPEVEKIILGQAQPLYGTIEAIEQNKIPEGSKFRDFVTVSADNGVVLNVNKGAVYTKKDFEKAVNAFKNNQRQLIQQAEARIKKAEIKSYDVNKGFAKPVPAYDEKAKDHSVIEFCRYGTNGQCRWGIDKAGTLTIYPNDKDSIAMLSNQEAYKVIGNKVPAPMETSWRLYATQITKVVVESGVKANKDASFLFAGLYRCKEMDLSGLDMSETQNVQGMFQGCKSLEHMNAKNLNLSCYANKHNMFSGCDKLDLRDFFGVLGKVEDKKWHPPKTKVQKKEKNHDNMNR